MSSRCRAATGLRVLGIAASMSLAAMTLAAQDAVSTGGASPGGAGTGGPGTGGIAFTNLAREAGLTAVTVYGGQRTNRYLLETTGCGVALLDYDNDGAADTSTVRPVDCQQL